MNHPAYALHARIGKLGVDALLFNHSETAPSSTVRWVSGFSGSDGAVTLTRTERHLFTDGRYKTQAALESPGFRIHIERGKLEALGKHFAEAGVKRVGIEPGRVSWQFVRDLEKRADVEPIPLSSEFSENLRIRKTPEERDKIRRAARIASSSCKEILEMGLVDKTEREVAAELERLFRMKGAEGAAFDTIVASGERSALPHGAPTEKLISRGDLVVVDYGCIVEGWRSDETVTCKIGKPTVEDKKIHTAVREAHDRALDAVKVGLKLRDLDGIARKSIEDAGYGKFFMHGLGHGLGLDTHEPPSVSPRGRGALREGMVFTIEPGIYLEGLGGVRLESLVYLGAAGPEVLSEMPKGLIQIKN